MEINLDPIQKQIDTTTNESQFGVTPVPYHTHTGIDSPLIDTKNLESFVNVNWSKYFRWFTFFESLDGYSKQGNAPTIDETGVILTTTNVGGNFSHLLKNPATNILKFNTNTKFKLDINPGAGCFTSSTIYLTVGTWGIGESYFGFEILDGVLYGSSSNPDTIATNKTTLATLSDSVSTYTLEARLYDKGRIDFYLDNVQKGTVSTEIPIKQSFADIVFFYLKTDNAAVKTITIPYFEYIQER